MKKNSIKTTLLISLLALGLLGCSRIIDGIWNLDASEFPVKSTAIGSGQIKLTFEKSNHKLNGAGSKTSDDILEDNAEETTLKDEYFWGYYIYRNSTSQYDDYNLIGVDGFMSTQTGCTNIAAGAECNNTAGQPNERRGASNNVETDTRFIDSTAAYTDSCAIGTTYYYRVVVVYRKYDKSTKLWKNELVTKDKSGWTTAKCQ
jgi:hypothetical protein